MSDKEIYNELEALGQNTALPTEPTTKTLESIENPHLSVDYAIRFTCPEFTSLCPKTGQPDFAHIVIDYIPRNRIVESKSLKLYLHSYRNHGDFHEACTVQIGKDIAEVLDPTWLRVAAYWYPRGGIPIDVFYQTGKQPEHIWVPELDVAGYRGRG